jgi:hypothetical protein
VVDCPEGQLGVHPVHDVGVHFQQVLYVLPPHSWLQLSLFKQEYCVDEQPAQGHDVRGYEVPEQEGGVQLQPVQYL